MNEYILKAVRSAPSNAKSTGSATSLVSREHADLPVEYDSPGNLVEASADAYRAGVLLCTDGGVEYLLWAENTSSFTTLGDPSQELSTGSGAVVGEDRIFVRDDQGRDVSGIIEVVLVSGLDPLVRAVITSSDVTDMGRGIFVVDAPALAALGGALSKDRGDYVESVRYYLAAPRFSWTRNDDVKRFGWDGTSQRWRPIRGSAPSRVGLVPEDGSTLTLLPRPSRLVVGQQLHGDPTIPDEFSTLRVGLSPGEESDPVSTLVVPDDDVTSSYPFPVGVGAVVGVTSGEVAFEPAFAATNANRTLWYSPEDFDPTSSGVVGYMGQDEPIFLAPVPELGQGPMVRLGSRKHLSPVEALDEAGLAALTLSSGQFGWAASTGRVRLSDEDVAKSVPSSPTFDVLFLGAAVVYDGVAMTSIPVPIRAPVQLVDGSGAPALVGSGELFIPNSVPLPEPGTSGIMLVPDGTGIIPNTSAVPGVRSNGSGLVREVSLAGEDAHVFSGSRRLTVDVVDFESDLPKFSFKVDAGRASVARELRSGAGSKVMLSRTDDRAFDGLPAYFIQPRVTLSTSAQLARIGSTFKEPYVLTGDETFYVTIDGTTTSWSASTLGPGSWSASEVAESLSVELLTGFAFAYRGRLYIEAGDLNVGSVEVGFGPTGDPQDRDVSGASALGLLPGWRVDAAATTTSWLTTGVSVALARSPLNLDGSGDAPDVTSEASYDDAIFADPVIQSPVLLLRPTPLLDVPGYDYGVFFKVVGTTGGSYEKLVVPYSDALYEFESSKMSWVEPNQVLFAVSAPTSRLSLGTTGVVGTTLDADAFPGNGLRVDVGDAPLVPYILGEDYLVTEAPGVATLIERVSPTVLVGVRGVTVEGDTYFEDADVDLSVLSAGDLLITGSEIRVITSVVGSGVEVDHPFESSTTTASWEVKSVPDVGTFDPGILVDAVYAPVDPSGDETVLVKVVTPVGALNDFLTVMSGSYGSERVRWLRVVGEDLPVTYLTRILLGVLSDGLVLPTSTHFEDGAFEVLVGTETYTPTGVTVFTTPLVGDVIEYGLPGSPVEGQLRFGDEVFDVRGESNVYMVELFSNVLPPGTSEMDPTSGVVRSSTGSSGDLVQLVERLDAGSDFTMDPIQGRFTLSRPLKEGQRVEVTYALASVSGERASDYEVEQVPVGRVVEDATRASALEYTFNAEGRTVNSTGLAVWVDDRKMNFIGVDVTVDVVSSVLRFVRPVSSSATVKISYRVLEAVGGEQGFALSRYPAYRPPFFLASGQGTFTVNGDQVGTYAPGCLFKVDGYAAYVESSTFSSGATTVVLSAAPRAEVGSRTPGRRASVDVTSIDVLGTMLPVDAAYGPVGVGDSTITFVGDVTSVMRPGHVLDVGGHPSPVRSAELLDGGGQTLVVLGVSNTVESAGSLVRVSARPVYEPGVVKIQSLGEVLVGEGVTVMRLSPGGPGVVLTEGLDYVIEPNLLTLNEVQPGQTFRISCTRIRELAPYYLDGSLILPRYSAAYSSRTIPSESNGLYGQLLGSFTFSSPDSYYVRTVLLQDYVGEVVQAVRRRTESRTNHGGPVVVSGPPTENFRYGVLDASATLRELEDDDRAARSMIETYDGWVQALEQVVETTSGGVVGDRDGKFRFDIRHDEVYPGPGDEDPFSGLLVPHVVWCDVFVGAGGPTVTQYDPVVDPTTASASPSGVVSGSMMDPWLMDYYMNLQDRYVYNDVDDVLLVGKGRAKLSLPFKFEVYGVFRSAWDPSPYSRLYPERTRMFTITYPGIGAGDLPEVPGSYAFAKLVSDPNGGLPVVASTFGMDVADVSNPALGLITGITGTPRVKERLPRGRIFAYSPVGFPEVDAATAGKPSLIVTPLELSQFPISPETGLPDVSQLSSQGGDLADLVTGDPSQVSPPWSTYADGRYPQVALGSPDGSVRSVRYAGRSIRGAFSGAFTSDPVLGGVFVANVYSGCVVTLTSGDGDEITDASLIVILTEDGSYSFDPARGDTLMVIPPDAVDVSGTSNPPPLEEASNVASQQPLLDVGFRERSSTLVDRSLPSARDPSFPIKEIVGQRSPTPLQAVEADVEFTNSASTPHAFPALLGLPLDDSGDRSIPYLSTSETEVDVLRRVQADLTAIVTPDGPFVTHDWLAVYPDEVVGTASVSGVAVGSVPPATLVFDRSLTPVADAGSYTPRSGVGDVRPFDLVLVESDQAVTTGLMGIQTAGLVTSEYVETPRFPSGTKVGSRIRYTFENVMGHLSTDGSTGVVVEEVGSTTTFTFSGVGFVLNDGSAFPIGGLNEVFSNALYGFPNENRVTIRLISQSTGLVSEVVSVQGLFASGGAGVVPMGTIPLATSTVLTINATGFVDFSALGSSSPGPTGTLDVVITVDTFVSTVSIMTGSATAGIGQDRLTFTEALDMRGVLQRGSTTSAGVSVQGELSVYRITVDGSTDSELCAPSEVNDGQPFTFLPRDSSSSLIGTFSSGLGSVTVMGVEGAGNVSVVDAVVRVSAIPSSDQDESGPILSGTAQVGDGEVWLRNVSPLFGALSNVDPGDVVVIEAAASGEAAVTCGTYLVRHAVQDDGVGYAEVYPTVVAGFGSGWVTVNSPKVTSYTSPTLVASSSVQVYGSPTGYDWAASGRIYVIPDLTNLSTVVSRTYTSAVFSPDGVITFTMDTSGLTAQDAAGNPIPDALFDARVSTGVLISGMVYAPIRSLSGDLPSNSVIGDGGVGGFVEVTLQGDSGSVTFTSGSDLVDATPPSSPSVDELGVAVSDATLVSDPTVFSATQEAPVYIGVPMYLDLTGIMDATSTTFATIRGGAFSGVRCILKGDILHAHDDSKTPGTGFRATSGVFFEPSFPRPAQNVGDGVVKVVDADHSVPSAAYVGVRSPTDYGATSPELVSFSVRRIRRFHDVMLGANEALSDLRFVYERRVGVVQTYDSLTLTLTLEPPGTQLGGLTDARVNVQAGDVVQVGGTTRRVARVVDDVTLRLRPPGLDAAPGDAVAFDVLTAPVPHEQSEDQVLDLLSQEILYEVVADPSSGVGGRVATVNVITDMGADYEAAGVQPGDVIIVDPAGPLSGPSGPATPVEYGAPPAGDQSVPGRTEHVPGGPSELDDNRGHYRVVQVLSPNELEVTGVTEFTGDAGSPVILGSSSPVDQRFVILPVVTDGLGGPEGQMDLRVTAPAGTSSSDPNSYTGNLYSVEPFSYRVVRQSGVITEGSADVLLILRERRMSWSEKVGDASSGNKSGDYYVFQEDLHLSDVGGTDPRDGLGVVSNALVTYLSGLTQYSPFVNTLDCTSVLDRRVWCGDDSLDRQSPPFSPSLDPYTSMESDYDGIGYVVGSGRPHSVDLLQEIMGARDGLRDSRFSWLRYRVDQVSGTLPSIRRLRRRIEESSEADVDAQRITKVQ